MTDPVVLRKLAQRVNSRQLEGKALLRATIEPKKLSRFAVMLNAIKEGPQLNEALEMIYKNSATEARKLYNLLKPHNPTYYMR